MKMDDIGRAFFGEGEQPGIEDGYQAGQQGGDPEGDSLQQVVFEFLIPDSVEYLFSLITNRPDECHNNEN